MYLNDGNGNETPVEGTGEEMIPERGMPFEEDESAEGSTGGNKAIYDENREPRDLSAEEMAILLDVPASVLTDTPPDKGMSAKEPIGTEGDLPSQPGSPDSGISLPKDESTIGMPAFSDEAFYDTGSAENYYDAAMREGSADLKSTDDMLNLFITKGRLKRLWGRIDIVQRTIRDKIPSLSLARLLADQVERARNELLAGPHNFEEAERSLNEVELRIVAVERAQRDNYIAVRLLFYELAWGIFLIFAYIYLAPYFQLVTLEAIGSSGTLTLRALEGDLLLMAKSAVSAAIGGVIGGLYALWRHVSSEIDFSKQYTMWYITSPIMGIFLGIFIFLVMRAGLVTMTIGSDIPEITFPYIIYTLALIVGFQQNVAFDLMRRVLRVFRLSDKTSE